MTDLSIFRVYEPDECGKDGYPFAWRDLGDGVGVKDLVRTEAGNRCVRCGHPYQKGMGEWSRCDLAQCSHGGLVRRLNDEGEWVEIDLGSTSVRDASSRMNIVVEARWRILTVHHLRTGHDAKRDLRWWHLVPLCQRDHLTIQRRVQMERIWPWPHSDWFRPYAAGWYAWAYERRSITREEAEERMDELLAYELSASDTA
jgi:hypothetical protein